MPTAETAEEFLALAAQYQLGTLDTEGFHPRTAHLSQQAQQDLPAALRALQAVDVAALERFQEKSDGVAELAKAVNQTFAAGKRVYLCGCGATGRLSLAAEWLGRAGMLPTELAERVIGFMAGGDAALIRSIENFEDFPEYGARQLDELGFADGDLLIASTEGGETPWVIGAAERAAATSKNLPWFLYCNPDAPLRAAAERSRRVLDDPCIRKLNLHVGPMALAGSTRMQASTVLLAAVGLALEYHREPAKIGSAMAEFLGFVRAADFSRLAPLTAAEAEIYYKGACTLYRTRSTGLTTLTDTTERSPTFSLAAFENSFAPEQPTSLTYLHLPGTPDARTAWKKLLLREPRTLEWTGLEKLTSRAWLEGYDFSDKVLEQRINRTRTPVQYIVQVEIEKTALRLSVRNTAVEFPPPPGGLLGAHLYLKMLLNAHSTAVMARLGRCRGNLMTFVRASNLKLIDRAVRYARQLYRNETGQEVSYETAVRALFAVRPALGPNDPAVLKVLEYLQKNDAAH
ncbi:MAG TPA: SIS domain-containing protein [Opitutales bacterium]|nr:SIS domain-containing protein [Opitutales bacterium]